MTMPAPLQLRFKVCPPEKEPKAGGLRRAPAALCSSGMAKSGASLYRDPSCRRDAGEDMVSFFPWKEDGKMASSRPWRSCLFSHHPRKLLSQQHSLSTKEFQEIMIN